MSSQPDSSQLSSITSGTFNSQSSDRRSNHLLKNHFKTPSSLTTSSEEELFSHTALSEAENRVMTRDPSFLKQETRKLHKRSNRLSRVGTPDYMAPELLLGTYSGPANDWWSVGTIIYELLVGFPPFNDTSPELIFSHIVNKEMEWPQVILKQYVEV